MHLYIIAWIFFFSDVVARTWPAVPLRRLRLNLWRIGLNWNGITTHLVVVMLLWGAFTLFLQFLLPLGSNICIHLLFVGSHPVLVVIVLLHGCLHAGSAVLVVPLPCAKSSL